MHGRTSSISVAYIYLYLSKMLFNGQTIMSDCFAFCYNDVIFVFIVFYVDPASGLPYAINLCVVFIVSDHYLAS